MIQILRPVTPAFVTQPFGAKSPNYLTYHRGIDYRTVNLPDKNIRAAQDGSVFVADDDCEGCWFALSGGVWKRSPFYGSGSDFGRHLILRHEINGDVFFTLYGHLQNFSRNFVVGEIIKAGQIIGTAGNTGRAQGEHLHFELRLGKNAASSAVNPEPYFVAGFNPDNVPDWGDVFNGCSAESVWLEAKSLGKVKHDAKFDDPITKGELIIFFKRFGLF